MGGAESSDKLWRIRNVTWYEEEVPNYMEQNYGLENLEKHGNKVDAIIAHTCPRTIARIYCAQFDPMVWKTRPIIDDPMEKYFEHIAQTIEFETFCFGHWHKDWDYGKYHMFFKRIKELV